jgi:membrane fusion protein (multidrug efflux system)
MLEAFVGRLKERMEVMATSMLRAGALTVLVLAPACARKDAPAPRPVDVLVVPVVQMDVPVVGEWIGTLDGSVNADIRPKIEGYLLRQFYKEGQFVHRNDPLFEIDPRQFRAALEQARGTLARAEAQLSKATNDVDRFTPLAAQRAISQQELDNAIAAQRDARGGLSAARAAVDQSALNLGWTRVTSPIDGIAGIAKTQGRRPRQHAVGDDHRVHRRSHPRDHRHLRARIHGPGGQHQPRELSHDRAWAGSGADPGRR